MFGDLKMPLKTYGAHWVTRIVGLIIVPVLFYMSTFYIHFTILNRSGEGDATMSSLFQANLIGIDFASNPLGMIPMVFFRFFSFGIQ
jgi:dolichyl-phosphate-mannose-protein mannosyltransferase